MLQFKTIMHCAFRFSKLIVAAVALTSVSAADAETIPFGNGNLNIQALTDNAFRITYREKSLRLMPEWIYVADDAAKLKKKVKGAVTSLTAKSGAAVVVDTQNATVAVNDKDGKQIFKATEHTLRRADVAGEPTYVATLKMDSPKEEYIFGLGQFQDGYANLRGLTRRLTQVNTQISVPMIISSRGYGLLWNNYGMTEFNPADNSVSLTRQEGEGEREVVNVTSTTGGRNEVRVRNIFQGEINIPADGWYAVMLDVGQAMARRHDLDIDGTKVINMRNVWLPPTTSIRTYLTKGTHKLTAELERGDKPVVYYKPVTDSSVFQSPVADAVDYTVFVGTADEVVAAYRHLTGQAPMMPKWAVGYIHCRERFHNQDEIVRAAKRFREFNIPLDLIVQDWQWWGKYGWNAMKFDENHYPDPKRLVDELHDIDVRLMLSVWSKIDRNSELGKEMNAKGYYIPGTDWIDFFNEEAAKSYWDNFSSRLMQPYGIDAWWQDATEPENDDLKGRKVGNGKYPGELFRNVYPLLVNKTVFEGSRRDAPQRRAMILTRCGFPGIQRYGAAMWSGDVGNDFETLRRQIIAGLGMQAAGMPWWTFDAGGFFRPGNQYNDPEYQERMLRWIETSVYLPLMRVHGYMSDTEPWRYGEQTQKVFADCIRQRYRLLPYIYSYTAEVTRNGGTIMRPLIFDFASDDKALQQECEYMFGRELLVSPVVEKGVSQWNSYLPQNQGGWFDFYTGKHFDGGRNVTTPVDISRIPVFARAGSIIPMGGEVQSTAQKDNGPLTIRVYPGRDADFQLYDDEGTNYNYEKGAYAIVPLHWDDRSATLSVGARQGSYDGMATERQLIISLPDGTSQQVNYTGKKLKVKMR